VSVRKVVVDIETLAAWCRARGRRIDGAAPADDVVASLQGSRRLQRLYQSSEPSCAERCLGVGCEAN
jgi:hypothetical protein